MKQLKGALLNVWLAWAEPTNRNEKRQAKKCGYFRRSK